MREKGKQNHRGLSLISEKLSIQRSKRLKFKKEKEKEIIEELDPI